MEIRDMINRLNELYKISQQRSLNETELTERDELRRRYLAMIRGRVKESLEQLKS